MKEEGATPIKKAYKASTSIYMTVNPNVALSKYCIKGPL